MSCPNNPNFETIIELIERDSHEFEAKAFEDPKQAILELTMTYKYTKAVWKHLPIRPIGHHYAGDDFSKDRYVLFQQSYSCNPLRAHYASARNKKILGRRWVINVVY